MKPRHWLSPLAVALALATTPAPADHHAALEPENQIEFLQESGQLDQATALINQLLDEARAAGHLPNSPWIRSLEFELERNRRIALDYSLTRGALLERVQQNLRDVSEEEFNQWVEEERFDRKFINGEERFVGSAFSSSLYRHPDLAARRINPRNTAWDDMLLAHVKEVREEIPSGAYLGLPRSFEITMTVSALPGTVPLGEMIRYWIPFPQNFSAATDINLLAATPKPTFVNAPNYPARSVYFEVPSLGAEPTPVSIRYTLTNKPRLYHIDPERVAEAQGLGLDQSVQYFLEQKPPHVIFTPQILALAAELRGEETNPAIIARRIYDWIAENIRYSFAREYSTLRNISMYCLDNGFGDCGQVALLYITLCRANGIPARWQSGWIIYPNDQNLHDWCEIYLEPYGWVPVDPNYAMFVVQQFNHMSAEDRASLKDFFFGGMDAYRLVINSDHGHPHFPPKTHFRSDDVDFQRGEVESETRNLFFNEFSRRLELRLIDEKSQRLAERFPM